MTDLGQQGTVSSRRPQPKRRSGNWVFLVPLGLLVVSIAILAWLSRDDTEAANSSTGSETTLAPSGGVGAELVADTELLAPTANTPGEISSEPAGLKLVLGKDFSMTASGVVHDEATRRAILVALGDTYGTNHTAEVRVNPELEAPSWAPLVTPLVKSVPTLYDGTVEITKNALLVSGNRGQTGSAFDQLLYEVIEQGDFPPLNDTTQVLDLKAPMLSASMRNGKLKLSGVVQTPQLRDIVVGDAQKLFGTLNVSSDVAVDPKVFSRYPMSRAAGNFEAFAIFGDFEFELENDTFVGTITTGLDFESDSALVPAETQTQLDGIVLLLKRSQLRATIVGYTDSENDVLVNIPLSKARAEAIKAVFVENGIESDRLDTAVKGSTVPLVSQESDGVSAQNHRVEIIINP